MSRADEVPCHIRTYRADPVWKQGDEAIGEGGPLAEAPEKREPKGKGQRKTGRLKGRERAEEGLECRRGKHGIQPTFVFGKHLFPHSRVEER